MDTPIEQANKTCTRLGIKPAARLLVVRLGAQTMQFFKDGKLVRSYTVSTSRQPPSNVKDSRGTPPGLHEIAERIGGGQPPGMVFKSRVPTGRHYSEFPDAGAKDNLITTRILWLRGLEPGVNQGGNVDSHGRYIYIHGTNHEDRIGERMSAGCVLMRNTDIAALYDEVRAGDQVYIAS
jgi:lipoprotein-anchoring transpeptidase ErfK/SrfK